MYPNDLILENTVLKNNKLSPIHDFITYDECSVCWKKVTGIQEKTIIFQEKKQ